MGNLSLFCLIFWISAVFVLYRAIFHRIPDITDKENKENIEQLFDLYRLNVNIQNNFFLYQESSTLNVVDLFEGAAFCFQKIINRTFELETFLPKEDSPYLKANKVFKANGGSV